MLRMVYRRFQTKNTLSQFYDFADLSKVTFRGDPNMNQFLQQWSLTLNGLKNPEHVPDGARLEMFL